MVSSQDRRIDELYAVPLPEFVERRNRLAGELREAGHQAEATRVKRLPKPSVPIWTINRLARQDAAGVNKFIDTVARLRRAHLRDPGEVPEATASQRAALSSLLHHAEDIMEAVGLKPSPAMHRRLSDTLLGAAADPQLQADLHRGRLAEEQQAPGFEVLEGARLRAIPGGRRDAAPTGGQPKARSVARTPIETRSAERNASETPRQAQADAQQKQRKARELDQVVARRRKTADTAATRAQALRRELQILVEQEASERAAADAAEREARRLRE